MDDRVTACEGWTRGRPPVRCGAPADVAVIPVRALECGTPRMMCWACAPTPGPENDLIELRAAPL